MLSISPGNTFGEKKGAADLKWQEVEDFCTNIFRKDFVSKVSYESKLPITDLHWTKSPDEFRSCDLNKSICSWLHPHLDFMDVPMTVVTVMPCTQTNSNENGLNKPESHQNTMAASQSNVCSSTDILFTDDKVMNVPSTTASKENTNTLNGQVVRKIQQRVPTTVNLSDPTVSEVDFKHTVIEEDVYLYECSGTKSFMHVNTGEKEFEN